MFKFYNSEAEINEEFNKRLQEIQTKSEEVKKLTEEDKLKIMNEVAKYIKSNSENIKVYGGYGQNLLIFRKVIFKLIFNLYRSRAMGRSFPQYLLDDNYHVSEELVNKYFEVLTNHRGDEKLNYDVETFFNFLNGKIFVPNKDYVNGECFYNFNLMSRDNEYLLSEAHDFDLYSPKPLVIAQEVYKICQKLGYTNVKVRDAIHHGTYSVKIFNSDNSNFNVCDITYIEKDTFNIIETDVINGMNIVNYEWALTDYYKMFSDSYGSNFRFENVFNDRFMKFTKYFKYNLKYEEVGFKNTPLAGYLGHYLETFKIRDSLITTGFKAYNEYYNIYKRELSRRGINLKPQYLTNIYYEFISFDYKNDIEEFKKLLKQIIIDTAGNAEDKKIIDFKVRERRRFCYYMDYTTEFYVCNKFKGETKETLICVISGNNNMSIPYQIFDDRYGRFKISSHTYTIYHFFSCLLFRYKFNVESKFFRKLYPETYKKTITNLLYFQSKYFEIFKISPFHISYFEFVTAQTFGTPVSSSEYKQTFPGFRFFKTLEFGNDVGRDTEIENWIYINISGSLNNQEEKTIKSSSASPLSSKASSTLPSRTQSPTVEEEKQ